MRYSIFVKRYLGAILKLIYTFNFNYLIMALIVLMRREGNK
ncbi:hypothetical protein LM500008_90132 [Listeria monocytogenes]|nr:hypothetical protein LM500008_90132 [Listeria monocytogenes]CUK42638.1 hypothetical protein LM500172_90132 [Listeria monocytogenes]CUK63128.1 hypothetical protein LM601023_140140 [Listeria monocytogenes]CUL64806.1 hypothetical protein LM800154_90132 [Listeria monocytogenes]CUL72179.1 hypothetical protein LM801408_210176 [Listeria monocytogenes]